MCVTSFEEGQDSYIYSYYFSMMHKLIAKAIKRGSLYHLVCSLFAVLILKEFILLLIQ